MFILVPKIYLKPRRFPGALPLDPCRGLGLWTPPILGLTQTSNRTEYFLHLGVC